MYVTEKEKVNTFIKSYFKNLRVKYFVVLEIVYIIKMIVVNKWLSINGVKDVLIFIAFEVITIMFMFFAISNFMEKQTQEAVKNVYNSEIKNKYDLVVVCNLKKINGPTFGSLYIGEKTIEFKPFRKNLEFEGFKIKEIEINKVKLCLSKINSSLLNKSLNKTMVISLENKQWVLQLAEPEKAIKRLKEMIAV